MIHRLDHADEAGAMFMVIIGLFMIDSPWGYLCVAGLLWLVIALARLPLARILRGLKPVLFIMIFTFVLHVFFSQGTVLWQVGPLQVTEEGLIQGVQMGMRLILLVVSASHVDLDYLLWFSPTGLNPC